VDPRQIVRANGIGRALLGVLLVIAPGPIARLWLGSRGALEPRVLGRTHGVRDIALGAGLVWAIERDEPARAWVLGSALCDAVDAAATLAFWNSLPRLGRVLVAALATGSAIQLGSLAGRIDD
jgi:hypothetical protein